MSKVKVKHVRGSTEFINSCPIKDGQKLYDTDTGKEYMDVGSERIERHKNLSKLSDTVVDSEHSYSNLHSNGVYSNALVRTVQGEVIAVDDVSPLEHEVGCKVERRNLLPYPYLMATGSKDGINYDVSPDGSVHIYGTKTTPVSSFVDFRFFKNGVEIPGNTVSFISDIDDVDVDIVLGSGGFMYADQRIKPITTVNRVNEGKCLYCVLRIRTQKPLDFTIHPMLTLEAKEVPYTPYIPDLSKVTVSRYGKNLIDTEKVENPDNWVSESPNSYYFPINLSPSIESFTISVFALEDTKYYYLQGKDEGDTEFSTSKGGAIVAGEAGYKKGTFQYVAGRKYRLWTNRRQTIPFISKVQIEIGNDATAYEKGLPAVSFAPSPEGIVSGMTSLSPDMTILTDTPGALLDVSYNQDIGKTLSSQVQTNTQAIIDLAARFDTVGIAEGMSV